MEVVCAVLESHGPSLFLDLSEMIFIREAVKEIFVSGTNISLSSLEPGFTNVDLQGPN